MVAAFDGARQDAADAAGDDVAVLVDSAAIDPASWVPVPLHAPRPDRAFSVKGHAHASFGRVAVIGAPAPRGGIPADRILRMPEVPMRVLHAPPAFASFAPPRRRKPGLRAVWQGKRPPDE
jgi:hypothetical protein